MSKQGFGQQLSEQDFILLQKGKQNGFVAAYKMYADHVYSLSLHLVCDEEIAADILQTIFENLIQKKKQLKGADSLGAWLKRCTINACMEYFRRVKREHSFRSLEGEAVNVADEIANNSTYQESEVAQLINQLPEAQRSIVYLHAVQNMKHREIAKSLNVNEDASRQSYRRAIQKLKSWLTKAN
ncbi:sigma-70 family RNA polymerase sigma factor [Thalassotalea sp. M1531]|uniref:Sigma-70 family RNA polymerase sigma factor n=1 Tax=Thalassotalea algicola TaxID=2716224 RepID=A0A7Y0LC82_9GAMM|nr:sigma-70 family RNA polymerase sigma factor [Thalassotalea algicola]NMP31884.1 sigma-70 family RNA polymerase sigma factor [Thalassotalea algicola]